MAPLSMVSKRHDVVDFTLPIMSAGLRILYKVLSLLLLVVVILLLLLLSAAVVLVGVFH